MLALRREVCIPVYMFTYSLAVAQVDVWHGCVGRQDTSLFQHLPRSSMCTDKWKIPCEAQVTGGVYMPHVYDALLHTDEQVGQSRVH